MRSRCSRTWCCGRITACCRRVGSGRGCAQRVQDSRDDGVGQQRRRHHPRRRAPYRAWTWSLSQFHRQHRRPMERRCSDHHRDSPIPFDQTQPEPEPIRRWPLGRGRHHGDRRGTIPACSWPERSQAASRPHEPTLLVVHAPGEPDRQLALTALLDPLACQRPPDPTAKYWAPRAILSASRSTYRPTSTRPPAVRCPSPPSPRRHHLVVADASAGQFSTALGNPARWRWPIRWPRIDSLPIAPTATCRTTTAASTGWSCHYLAWPEPAR